MIPELKKQSFLAELATLDRMLASRTEADDPIGYFQLSERVVQLRQELGELDLQPVRRGGIALFFAGEPVFGSFGIRAEFAGKAVKIFQEMVSKRFATFERGALGERGVLPLRMHSDLMITDVARGSFGIVLEEAAQDLQLADTELAHVLDDVAHEIDLVAKDEAEDFELFMAFADQRYLTSLGEFFSLLYDERATIRVVEGPLDRALSDADIRLARDRIASVDIKERETSDAVGRLFLLPEHRKFELRTDSGETIYGVVSVDFPKEVIEAAQESGDVVSQRWRVKIRERTITRPQRQPKKTNVLLGLIERISN